jgi:hypothetical protein
VGIRGRRGTRKKNFTNYQLPITKSPIPNSEFSPLTFN